METAGTTGCLRARHGQARLGAMQLSGRSCTGSIRDGSGRVLVFQLAGRADWCAILQRYVSDAVCPLV